MMETFGRQIRMIFEDLDRGEVIEPSGRDLNINFTVERTLDKEPSTMGATIYNLKEETRSRLRKSPNMRVTLQAGYTSDVHTIFVGDVRNVRQRNEPPIIATDVEAGDGEKGAKNWARKWFGKGTSVDAVFRYLATTAGYGPGNIGSVASIRENNGLPARLESGIHVRGYAVDELYELSRSRGIDFSIQNNEVQLLPFSGGKTGVPITKMNASTGMIGFPSVDNKGILTVNHRLNPNIFPGSLVEVETSDGSVSGRYKVLRALYSGSLWGDEFNIEIEGKAVAA